MSREISGSILTRAEEREGYRRYSTHRCIDCIFPEESLSRARGNGYRSPCCAAFIAAPYIGTLSAGLPGCAYINNNCRANNKPEGSALDSPKLLVPLPRGARFYCLLSSARNGGSPLHRPRWRINDPAIRHRAANARFSSSLSVFRCVVCAFPWQISRGIVRELVKSRKSELRTRDSREYCPC